MAERLKDYAPMLFSVASVLFAVGFGWATLTSKIEQANMRIDHLEDQRIEDRTDDKVWRKEVRDALRRIEDNLDQKADRARYTPE